MARQPVAVIDVGTVSTRLMIADVSIKKGTINTRVRRSTITNLGMGVAEQGTLSDQAMDDTCAAIAQYVEEIRNEDIHDVLCTLTSAARDASNSDEMLARLEKMGITGNIISGEVEGRLTFLGVMRNFDDERILVADIGGGSTELVEGELEDNDEGEQEIDFDYIRSYDVGARRVSELYLERNDPPTIDDLDEARAFIAKTIESYWDGLEIPDRLVAVGGAATSIVSIHEAMEEYDSQRVHLYELSGGYVSDIIDMLAEVNLEERKKICGLQPRRADTILGGALILETVMAMGGMPEVTISESDSLVGLTLVCTYATDEENVPPIDWKPKLSNF